jgi:hypothetical protein
MTIDQTPLPQRVASSFSQLKAAAQELNSISDELGKPITEIDAALKKLNIGVAVWVPIRKEDGAPQESWYWREDIGYCKIGANWGISLRKISGDRDYPGDEQEEPWLFNDAPRILRIAAIEKIPELLERLSTEAVKTTEKIRARLSEAQSVAEAVKDAANQARIPSTFTAKQVAVPAQSSGGLNAESLRSAVVSALTNAGHSSAAQLLGNGTWKVEGTSVHVSVPGMGKKMLSLTVNAAAEKIVRQELQRLGAPNRFLVTAGEGPTPAVSASSAVPGVEK